jgi:hypothetical protein
MESSDAEDGAAAVVGGGESGAGESLQAASASATPAPNNREGRAFMRVS